MSDAARRARSFGATTVLPKAYGPLPRTDLTAYSGLLRVLVCDRSRDMLAPVSGTEAFLVHPGGAPSTPVVGLGDRRGGRRQARSEPTVEERAGSR